jgi:hypothetical protein
LLLLQGRALFNMTRMPLVDHNDPWDIADLLKKAVQLSCHCPGARVNGFLPMHAMLMVGMAPDIAAAMTNNFAKLKRGLDGTRQHDWDDDSADAKLKRALEIFALAKYSKDGTKSKEKAEIMRLAGCSYLESTGRGEGAKVYKRFSRMLEKEGLEEGPRRKQKPDDESLKMTTTTEMPATEIRNPPQGLLIPAYDLEDDELSPISTDENMSFGSVYSFTEPPPQTKISTVLLSALQGGTKVSSSNESYDAASAVSSVISKQEKRRTAGQAHEKLRSFQEYEEIRKIAYKVGSLLWNCAKDVGLALPKFKTADDCANSINLMFDIPVGMKKHSVCLDFVSGRQLADAVRDNRVGESPPRIGRKR